MILEVFETFINLVPESTLENDIIKRWGQGTVRISGCNTCGTVLTQWSHGSFIDQYDLRIDFYDQEGNKLK